MSGPGRRERIVVLGMMAKTPVAGVVWQTIHYLLGLERLGFEVHYLEAHGAPPKMFMSEGDDGSSRAAAFIERMLGRFGFGGRWAFEAHHADGACLGMSAAELRRVCAGATLAINLHGSTIPTEVHRSAERVVYLETDPTELQIEIAQERPDTLEFLALHDAFFTFGENYGNADCGLPVSEQFLFVPTRQPVLLDMWATDGPLPAGRFTTVGNWQQPWRAGIAWDGDHYTWSKHHEFAKVLDVPACTGAEFELALAHVGEEDRQVLQSHGWLVRDALSLSEDVDTYREFIAASRGEFTVAKDQNVRLCSGWFSDRSATYLASGRPVITQDTGFGNVLPTGEGLFAFRDADDVAAAVEAINSDPERHRRAAREIAREYFAHDVVLGRMLEELGLSRPRTVAGLPPALLITRRSRRPTTLEPATEAYALARPLPTAAVSEPSGAPRASIVMVTHGGLAFTRMAVESVLANTGSGGYELIVVDNASADGTREYLRAMADLDSRLRTVLCDENAGFAAATNRGLASAQGEVLALLNNDTIVTPGWLERLSAHLQDPAVGLVGPVTNDAPTAAAIKTDYRTHGQMLALARRRAAEHHGQVTELEMATMFCLALRREVHQQAGPLDEDYGLGLFEDDDYSRRVRRLGLRVVCAEDVFVHHFGQASFGALHESGEYAALLAANRERYEAKWGIAWHGHAARPSPQGERLARELGRLVANAVPDGATVAVVSRGDPLLLELGGREAWHFPGEPAGEYLGHHPADSSEAIERLEQLRRAGASFLVVPEPSLWWLEHYQGLAGYLGQEIARSEAGTVFALPGGGRPRTDHTVCCIAGMHRSGTSMVAQMLAAAGLWLGDPEDLFEPSADNPEGYFEHRAFVSLNDRLLEALGGAWDAPPGGLASDWPRAASLAELREEATELLKRFPRRQPWGWKDPRNSLTLPFWLELIPGLRVVVCVRHPLAVARSLHRRAMHSERFGLALWRAYNERLLGAIDPDRTLLVAYEAVLAEPEAQLDRLTGFLSLDPTAQRRRDALARVTPSLSRAPAPAEAPPPELAALYEHLTGLSVPQRREAVEA